MPLAVDPFILFVGSSGHNETMNRMRILAVSGSLRAGSSNLALLRAAAAVAPEGMELVLYEGVGTLPHFNPDLDGEGAIPPPAVQHLRGVIGEADAVVISSPEYAHGLPGSLKNALDWIVSSGELTDKPVVLLNASAAGGQRAQASLAQTLRVMGARVLENASLIEPFVRKKLSPGDIVEAEVAQKLRASLDALAHAVVLARGGLPTW
jgi:NAD(P)H-dependent FMN reductase